MIVKKHGHQGAWQFPLYVYIGNFENILVKNCLLDFKTDYAVIIDEETFELATPATKHKRALIAGTIGAVRLIDNMVIA